MSCFGKIYCYVRSYWRKTDEGFTFFLVALLLKPFVSLKLMKNRKVLGKKEEREKGGRKICKMDYIIPAILEESTSQKAMYLFRVQPQCLFKRWGVVRQETYCSERGE